MKKSRSNIQEFCGMQVRFMQTDIKLKAILNFRGEPWVQDAPRFQDFLQKSGKGETDQLKELCQIRGFTWVALEVDAEFQIKKFVVNTIIQ